MTNKVATAAGGGGNPERCFICGSRIGRGNHPHLPAHERINKLVSVSQTVEYSSTIISDILARILNETVMHEENICRICFNLLNDIDYHLKEAQEKTDEITNKFLDKGKDPLSYNPQPIVTAQEHSVSEDDFDGAKDSKGGRGNKKGRRRKGGASDEKKKQGRSGKKSNAPAPTWHVPPPAPAAAAGATTTDTEPEEGPLTEDEMSVNKAKLLSHVLNPRKVASAAALAAGAPVSVGEVKEDTDEEEEEDDDEEYYEPKTKKRRQGGRRGHRKVKTEPNKERRSGGGYEEGVLVVQAPEVVGQPQLVVLAQAAASAAELLPDGRGQEQLVTVNMEDLGHMASGAGAADGSAEGSAVYFAKKSEPLASSSSGRGGGEEEQQQIRCQECGRRFKRASNLQLHMERAHGAGSAAAPAAVAFVSADGTAIVPETHRCDLCPREFTNGRSLAAHKEAEHTAARAKAAAAAQAAAAERLQPPANNKPPATDPSEVKAVCPQCHKTFRRHFNMRIHVDRVHNKVKPFPCKFCPKSFATNSDLKQHAMTHGEGKKFECEECGRVFTNRDSIILHRKQHANERTHFCVVCDKGFFKASCLNRHMRTHTGERPYKCETCHKGFSQSTTLKQHRSKCPGVRSLRDEEDDDEDDD